MNKHIYTLVAVTLVFGIASNSRACAGSLDSTFNSTALVPGVVKTYFSESVSVNAAAVHPNGKIVVVGGLNDALLLVRYTKDGTLDTTFNHTGILQHRLGTTYAIAQCVALQADNKILVAGLSDLYLFIARYTVEGALDATFNGTGSVIFGAEQFSSISPEELMVQKDGKILVAGNIVAEGSTEYAILRYNSDGSLDTSFNPAGEKPGVLITNVGNYGSAVQSLALQEDGKIVLSGAVDGRLLVARYTADGHLDITFNGTGIVKNDLQTDNGKICIQKDGKIVVAATLFQWPDPFTMIQKWVVIRYNADGTLDTAFNKQGTKPGMTIIPLPQQQGIVRSLMLQKNGKIVVAGTALGAPDQFAIARYTVDGVLDKTFNSSGKKPGIVTTFLGAAVCKDATLGRKGKIILVGDIHQDTQNGIVVARYNGDPVV